MKQDVLRQQQFSYLREGGIFIVVVNKISEPSSVKIFFSHEKESKKNVYYHVEQKYIFSAKMQNLIFFSVR